jgi:hypothetical protein
VTLENILRALGTYFLLKALVLDLQGHPLEAIFAAVCSAICLLHVVDLRWRPSAN